MIVNVEFLSAEPLNNVITSMHFNIDKILFFGYETMVKNHGELTERFLKKYCGIKEVEFVVLPEEDFRGIRRGIKYAVVQEAIAGNSLFFDITGGDSLILVAFGQLSAVFGASMHMFDVEKDRLIEFDENHVKRLSAIVQRKEMTMNLDRFVEMRGGKINYRLQKNVKVNSDPEFKEDVDKMFDVAKQEWEVWNPFSEFLRTKMIPDETLQVSRKTKKVIADLGTFGGRLRKIERFNAIIDALAEKGILLNVVHDSENYRFRFKNREIKDCIWQSGSILEMNVYGKEKLTSDDCRVGVHLDWIGPVHPSAGEEVLNEIDVLTLRGNIMTFISCKSGKMDARQTLHALYELDTVAKRFGGEYARKVLVSAQQVSENFRIRAAEMKIEIRNE